MPWLAIGLLLVVLAAGVYFRFAGLDWDEEQHLHPDERFLTMVTSTIQEPQSLGEYFNSQSSPLNPYNNNYGLYVYGDLPIFLTRYLGGALNGLCQYLPLPDGVTWPSDQARPCFNDQGQTFQYTDYSHIYLVGRFLSALLDVLVLILMFLIGRRLYDTRVGILAAALGAATVLQIQQAHFYTADTIAMFFVVVCMFFILRFVDTFSWFDAIASGISGGLAVASRINVAPILGIIALAAFAHVLARWRDPARRATIEGALARIVVAAIFALITFRIFMPYAFDGLWRFDERWTSNMDYARRLNSGEDPGGPPGVQWTNRPAIVFPWINIVFWGMGVPLGLTAWFSWAWAAWQTFIAPYKRNRHGKVADWLQGVAQSRHLLIWVWVGAYFVWMGTSWVKSIRYQLPIYPFMTLLAAAGLMALVDWAARRASRRALWRALSIAVLAVVVVGTYGWAWAFTNIYRTTTTRVAASRWIYENIPTAVTLNLTANGATQTVQLPFPNKTILQGDNQPVAAPFEVQQAGTLESITLNRLIDLQADPDPETLRVTIATSPDGAQPVSSADLTARLEDGGLRGKAYNLPIAPAVLTPGQTYYAILTAVSGAPVQAESSTLANEHWDDPIPLRVEGRDGFSQYHGIDLKNYDQDSPEKLEAMLSWLDSTDYIMLTSNRLYASIPRMPHLYPMTSEFYRQLLTGQLGFKLKAVFESYPALGPLAFPDQETTQALGIWPDPTRCPQAGVATCQNLINVPLPPAEEAFSVYDHPRVLILEKTPDFNVEQARGILSRIDLNSVLRDATPQSETQASNNLMLPDDVWQAQQATGTWSDLFDRNGLFNQAPLIGGMAWYAAIFLIGLFAFPIVFAAAPGLRDRGYGVARMAGLLVAVFVVWFLASLPDRALYAHDDLVERVGARRGGWPRGVAAACVAARFHHRESPHALDRRSAVRGGLPVFPLRALRQSRSMASGHGRRKTDGLRLP